MRSKISTSPVATVFRGGKMSLMRATIFNDSFTTCIAVSPTFPVIWWLTGTIMGGGGRSGVLQEPRMGCSTCAGNWGTAGSESDWWSVRLSGTGDWVNMDDGWLVGERLRKILRNLSIFRGFWGFKDISNGRSERGYRVTWIQWRLQNGELGSKWPLTDIAIWLTWTR